MTDLDPASAPPVQPTESPPSSVEDGTGAETDNDVFQFCPNCGRSTVPNAAFCVACGQALRRADRREQMAETPTPTGTYTPTPTYTPTAVTDSGTGTWATNSVTTNGFAVASLVLGLLWISGVGSILALVFGYMAKGQIDESDGWQRGRGMAVWGIALGWIGLILLIGAVVLVAVSVSRTGG